MKNKYFLLIIMIFCSAYTYGQMSRLVGLTKTKYNGIDFATIGDTAYYMYSGTMDTTNSGGRAYDSSYTLVAGTGYTTGNLSYRYYQTFAGANVTATYDQSYDTASSSWINVQNYLLTYDASNNLTLQLQQNWNTASSAWENKTQTTYTFAGANNTLKLVETWNTTTSAWVNRNKDSFAYDASNNMIYHLVQNWNTTSGAWVNVNQYTDSYNSLNQVTSSLSEAWPPAATTWKNSTNTTYDYNAANLLSNTIVQHWDTTALSWTNFSSDSIVYDGANNKSVEARFRWDTGAHTWTNLNMDMFSFDASHNMLSDTFQNWNNTTHVFVNNRLKLYSYNTYNQVLISTTESWDNTAGAWYYRLSGGGPNGQDIQWRYYYSTAVDTPTSVGTIPNNTSSFATFPNPAHDLLNIQLSWNEPTSFTVGIYDITGGLVRQWMETSTKKYFKTIPVNDLPAGNYFIKATSQKQQLAQQFVILN